MKTIDDLLSYIISLPADIPIVPPKKEKPKDLENFDWLLDGSFTRSYTFYSSKEGIKIFEQCMKEELNK